jgi:hypothetical protein
VQPFIIKVTDTTIKFASSQANALAGTAIDLTTAGSLPMLMRRLPDTDDGRLWKVRVYGGINGMWLGVCKDAIVNRNASEFHSVVSKRDLRRRTFDRSTIRNRVTKRIEAAFSESAKSRNWRKCDALASMAEKFGLTLVANAKLVAT